MTNDEALLALLAGNNNGVLATLKRDGRPQLSNIVYGFDLDRRLIRVSVTADRAKTRNLARDPRVSLHVSAPNFGAWVVAEGMAHLSAVAQSPDDDVTDALVELYRSIRGEHPDWAEYRAAMVTDSRVAMSFVVEHIYGQA